MTCKQCGKPSYADFCYKCRSQQGKQDPEIKEVKPITQCVIWYNNVLKSSQNKYTSAEIYNAFDMCWEALKLVYPDKRKFERMRFHELLQAAWDYGVLPNYFVECADKIKGQHVPGKGLEILEGLGLINGANRDNIIPF